MSPMGETSVLREAARQQLDAVAQRGQTRRRWTAHGPTAAQQVVGAPGQEPQKMRLFCSNDYLGLASHPTLVNALVEGARAHGVGSGASHLVSGHHQAHEDLAATFARWFAPWVAQPQALGFSTGYMANLAVITGLAALAPRDEVAVFSDELNHASLIDACRLSKATVHRVPHADMVEMDRALARSPARVKLIVSDGVFSMDGDIAPVAELLALAERHDAWLILDDAHGVGVLGDLGRGTVEHALGTWPNPPPTDRLILVGTLGKAVGAAGAFVVAHEELIEALLQTARPYIFTTASPPALAVAVQAALDLIESPEGQRRRAHLKALLTRWRQGIDDFLARHPELAWALMPSDTPIQPLVVRHNERAVALSHALQAQGLRVPAIRPPTVAPGSARLRITFSADHQYDDVDALLAGLQQACHLVP